MCNVRRSPGSASQESILHLLLLQTFVLLPIVLYCTRPEVEGFAETTDLHVVLLFLSLFLCGLPIFGWCTGLEFEHLDALGFRVDVSILLKSKLQHPLEIEAGS